MTYMWATELNDLYVSYAAQQPKLSATSAANQGPPPCIASWDGWVEGMHCTFSLCSSIFPLAFQVQRFSMAIVQAIPPPDEEYPRSTNLCVFWVREPYEIPHVYVWSVT